jgi:LDH2 family malate/lactate/ureidoglycolate dehydrogenase
MKEGNISYQELSSFTQKTLEKLGYPKEQAEVTAWALVEADARGVPSHGVGRLPFYEGNIKSGFVFPDAKLEVVHETPLSLVVDGHNGIGPYLAKYTMSSAIEKAKKVGAGFGALRNSSHFGMAALWAEMATAEGFIGMSFTNTRICSVVTFGRERILGTNPICFAIPTSGKTPFVLDMATTTTAHGKVEVYERRKKTMPIGWVVDENGTDTTDTIEFQKLYRSSNPNGGHLFLGGAGEELGGHKGYGLGLFVDLLCAGMSMGAWSKETFSKTEGCKVASFFAAIRTDLFGNPKEIADHVEAILDGVRESNKAAGHDRIYIHGEKEIEKHAESDVDGVYLDEVEWKMLAGYAEKFGFEKLVPYKAR